MLQSVRSFKDEPTLKMIEASTSSERDAFETYLRSLFPDSMYIHGDNTALDAYNVPAGLTFFRDTIQVNDLIRANPVRLDAAALANGSWMHCYLYHPHIRTTSSVNIIVFPDQDYTITNEGTADITIYIRRYDNNGVHCLSKPLLIPHGQRRNTNSVQ